MVCKCSPKPTCAPDPLKLVFLPAELRLITYERIWELAEPCEPNRTIPLDFKQFNFFDLPLELRICIYECLLQPSMVDIYSYDRSENSDDEETPTEETPPSDAPITLYAHRIGPKVLNPAILRTCKAVHDEAQMILYRPIALALRPAFAYLAKPTEYEEYNSDVKIVSRIFRNYPVERFNCILQLGKMQIEIFTTSTTKEEDIAHSASLIKSFKGKIKVDKLELKIFNRFFGARHKDEEHWKIEKESTFELIGMWSQILTPKDLSIFIGDKPGIVLEIHTRKGKSTGRWKSALVTDDERQYCQLLISLLNELFRLSEGDTALALPPYDDS